VAKKFPPPKSTKGDVAHAVARAGLSAIPLAGGAAVEILQSIVQPPIERRRDEWMAEVGERLVELEERGLDLSSLQQNEEFISGVMHATQVAIRTHIREKRDALANAIQNIAASQAPEEALQHFFLNLVDELTSLHVQILRLFQAPPAAGGVMAGGLSHVLERGIPQLRGRRAVYDQFWKDLYARGLVNTEGLHVTMSGAGLAQKRTTELGDQFLEFISERAAP
jgi:hypothetical protein